MFTLIIIALIIVGFIVFKSYCDSDQLINVERIKESSIVKKFNRLLKHMTSNNIDVIKEKLLDTLEQYRTIKCAQFAENRTQLQEAIKTVTEQIGIITGAIACKRSDIIVRKDKLSNDEGARLVYDLELHKDILNKLSASKQNLEDKLSLINSKIAQFGSNLALRKAKIIAMIADTISINDNSAIDLRLDSLEKEFNHEALLNENKKYVSDNVENKESDTSIVFDREKYIELFKEFK